MKSDRKVGAQVARRHFLPSSRSSRTALAWLLFATGCGAPATSWRLATCETRPAVPGSSPSSTFPDAALPAGWIAEGELAGGHAVRCEPPSSDRQCITSGPLAAPYEGAEPLQGKLAQLGGDYWIGPADIGAGRCHLDTARLTGAVLSPIQKGMRFVSVLVGGGGGPSTRVELCVDRPPSCAAVPATAQPGPGTLGMTRATWDVQALGLVGEPLRVRVVVEKGADDRGLGFVLLDDLRAGDTPPPDQRPRLWGFVDLHAHLFNNLGSGGRLIHGDVFSSDSRDLSRFDKMKRALGTTCEDNHGQGGLAFTTEFGDHGSTLGFPSFEGWPKHTSVAHQQAYVDWIERAYRGGLRLVQMDVGNSREFAAAYEQLNGGVVAPLAERLRRPGDGFLTRSSEEDDVRDVELAMARRFVARDGPAYEWAEIATSAADARRIGESGKLVIVPGVEMDGPEAREAAALHAVRHKSDVEARPVVRAYVQKLYGEGIRHVFPVHVMPNLFGDPAVYDRALFCASLPEEGMLTPLADGMKDDIRYHVQVDQGKGWPVEVLMNTTLDPLPRSYRAVDVDERHGSFARADCYKANLLGRTLHRFESHRVEDLGSTKAEHGLSPLGALFVEESMRLGMLIDLTHMSQQSRADTMAIARRHHDYPLMASHVGFRELAMGNVEKAPKSCQFAPPAVPFEGNESVYGTEVITKVGYEYALTRAEVVEIRRLRGLVGLGFETDGVGVQWSKAVVPDCDGSSKSFAQAYLYARDLLGGHGVGFGTDVDGFYKLPSPRFEAGACEGAHKDALRDTAAAGHAPQIDATQVAYGNPPGPKAMLKNGLAGTRSFDVNKDGVAHYGLLPDFLQDLVNVGVTREELAAMFNGLEDYVAMWELAEQKAEILRREIP